MPSKSTTKSATKTKEKKSTSTPIVETPAAAEPSKPAKSLKRKKDAEPAVDSDKKDTEEPSKATKKAKKDVQEKPKSAKAPKAVEETEMEVEEPAKPSKPSKKADKKKTESVAAPEPAASPAKDEAPSKPSKKEKSASKPSSSAPAPLVSISKENTQKPKPSKKASSSAAPKKKSKAPTPQPEESDDEEEEKPEQEGEDASEDEEDEGHLHGFSTDEDSSDDDAMDDEPTEFDMGKLPTIAKDDATVKKKLEKAKKLHSEDRGVLYLGRIPHGFYEEQMKAYFSQFGDVTRIRLSRNKKTGRSKHYGFIEFESAAVAKIVAETMDNYLMMGHILRCKLIPKDEVHPELWVGANRKWRVVPQDQVARAAHNKPRTEDEQKKAERRLLKRQEQRKKKLAEMGIKYNFDAVGYVWFFHPSSIFKWLTFNFQENRTDSSLETTLLYIISTAPQKQSLFCLF
ncbi:hypothetical protein CVT24_000087 [Panaeolus cyanescens]|uniref:RRM domain-containing protein n=1 Tax=Panaeolus cyanescens TaxID=181874 RepID=A0A409VRW7_9AGAR|nr:hypothetical protein CVT24_000087 [Panaeolus cyanescens]